MAGTRRDLTKTTAALAAWFSDRLGTPCTVTDVSIPKAGFSNETVLGTLHARGESTDFVVRIQPTGHQLFLEPDATFQARMMTALRAIGAVPVPTVLHEETDERVLGAPFFVMERVHGRVPSDTPTWHAGGWTTELSIEERGRLYDNGLRALVALHAVEPGEEFTFLRTSPEGSPLAAHVEHLRAWHEWSTPSLRFGKDVIDAALAHLVEARPEDDSATITWGDARVGNMIFDDDLAVAAMLDWEGATLGPVGIDVAWWLMFEDFFSVEQGTPRLEGVPGPEETVARYVELGGREVVDLGYYLVMAGMTFALINSRLADLYITHYGADPERSRSFIDRTTRMTAAYLERAS